MKTHDTCYKQCVDTMIGKKCKHIYIRCPYMPCSQDKVHVAKQSDTTIIYDTAGAKCTLPGSQREM